MEDLPAAAGAAGASRPHTDAGIFTDRAFSDLLLTFVIDDVCNFLALLRIEGKIALQDCACLVVSMTAYEAGGAAGASLAINPGLGGSQSGTTPKGS
jgi:hypothetical protein